METDVNGDAIKLGVVEVLDRDGHARLVAPIRRWPITIGRAITCDVVLDDVHVAPVHATITETDGVLTVIAGDSINGVRLNRRRLVAQQNGELAPGAVLEMGVTRVRVRRTSDALAAERPLAGDPGYRRIVLLAAVFTAWTLGEFWLNADPGVRFTDYLFPQIGLVIALAIWSTLWAIGSKLIRHRFDFWPHVRVVLTYVILISLAGLLLPISSYAFGWVMFSRVAGIVMTALGAAMVLAHLRLVSSARPRVLAAVIGAIFATGLAFNMTRTYQVHDRLFDELYVATLAPPALRLAPGIAPAQFIDEARSLKNAVDAHVDDDDDDSGRDPFGEGR